MSSDGTLDFSHLAPRYLVPLTSLPLYLVPRTSLPLYLLGLTRSVMRYCNIVPAEAEPEAAEAEPEAA